MILNTRKWWLATMRLPEHPHEDWQPFFTYFPREVEGKLVWWIWVERSFFFAIDHVWCERLRLPRTRDAKE